MDMEIEKQELYQVPEDQIADIPEEDLFRIFVQHFTVFQGYDSSEEETQKKRLVYNLVSAKNNVKQYIGATDASNEIIAGQLYLGMQPNDWTGHPLLDEENNDVPDGDLKNSLNVAIIENHAMEGSLIGWIVGVKKPEQYEAKNIEYYWVSTPDHTAHLPDELFVDVLFKIVDYIKHNKKVFVHCKSGAGRSEMLVTATLSYLVMTCYLPVLELIMNFDTKILEHWNNPQNKLTRSLEERVSDLFMGIRRYVKKCRPNITKDAERIEMGKNKAVSTLITMYIHFKEQADAPIERTVHYKFLSELSQSNEFKHLSMQYSDISGRHGPEAEFVQKQIEAMLHNEVHWYENICHSDLGTQQLIPALERLAEKYPSAKFSTQVREYTRPLGNSL